jgi:hypothetical protein
MANPTFNYNDFIVQYPEFANFSNQQGVTNIYNYQACVQGNFLFNLFSDVPTQYYWLLQILCHIIWCRQNGVVGLPNSVNEGSNSVSFQFTAQDWGQYWVKSPYGQDIYNLIQSYAYGGYYIADGNPPYNSDSMSSATQIGGWDLYGGGF